MAIETEESNTRIIQALARAGSKTGGYSEVLLYLNSTGEKLIPLILQNWDELYFEFMSEKTNYAIEIGVSKPPERKIVIETIAEIKTSNQNIQNMQLLTLINQELISRNISYRLPIALAANLESIAGKSSGIVRGLINLRFLNKKTLVEEVTAFIGKYIPKQSDSLTPLIDILGQAITKMGGNASNTEIMQKVAIETLLKIGYLKVGIEGKDPGQLANVLFYEMVAAQGTFNAKKKKGREDVTKDEVIDQVAIVLVNSLR